MLLFIIIFFAMVIVVGVTAVAGFSFYLKHRSKLLDSNDQRQFAADPPPYRSLFSPTDEEILASEIEEKLKVQAKQKESEQKAALERKAKLREFTQCWRAEPNRQNTVELLYLATESKSAEIFSNTAEDLIRVLLYEQKGILTANDLADLLDSHIQILPQQERVSGAIFWVKREIKKLRGKSEENK